MLSKIPATTPVVRLVGLEPFNLKIIQKRQEGGRDLQVNMVDKVCNAVREVKAGRLG